MEGSATRPGRGIVLLGVTVAAVAIAFLVAVSPWAGRDPGYSLDGFNASVWGLGARAAADDPVASRLGGVQPDGDRYANHPPLTVWSAAVGDWVSGGRAWAVRAPAVLASIAALGLLALLLHDAGLRAGAAAAGVATAGTTGMFLTYGAMLDTPVVALPFGLLALVVAQRAWQGRPPAVPALMAAGAFAALAGWQAALAATLAAGVVALGAVDPPRLAHRAATSLAAGVALGVGLTLAWIGWVHTSVGPLFDQAGFRVNGRGTDGHWTTLVVDHVADLYGPSPVLALLGLAVVVALAGSIVALWGARGERSWWRPNGLTPVLVILLVTVVGYTLVFRNGAAVHDYWTYWGVALVATGAAGATQVALDLGDRAGTVVGRAVAVGVVIVVGVIGVSGLVHQPVAETRIREGLALEPILDEVPDADRPSQVAIAVYGAPGELPWADLAVRGRAARADDVDALRQLPPDLPVLVVLRGPPSEELLSRATTSNEHFVLLPASELLDHLGG